MTTLLPQAAAQPTGDSAIQILPPATRFVLQSRRDQLASIATVLGWPSPGGPLTARSSSARSTLALGPTELLLIEQNAGVSLRDVDAPAVPHSLVDVSHRQTALRLAGADAVVRLSSACPLDLGHDRFPAGSCTRTILGRCEIVLWRMDDATWHVECWRSFASYVCEVLTTPC